MNTVPTDLSVSVRVTDLVIDCHLNAELIIQRPDEASAVETTEVEFDDCGIAYLDAAGRLVRAIFIDTVGVEDLDKFLPDEREQWIVKNSLPAGFIDRGKPKDDPDRPNKVYVILRSDKPHGVAVKKIVHSHERAISEVARLNNLNKSTYWYQLSRVEGVLHTHSIDTCYTHLNECLSVLRKTLTEIELPADVKVSKALALGSCKMELEAASIAISGLQEAVAAYLNHD